MGINLHLGVRADLHITEHFALNYGLGVDLALVERRVERYTTSEDINRFHFSTAGLSPGAYHYTVLEGDGLLGEGKLVVVH